MDIASLIIGIISLIIGIVPFCGIVAVLPAIIGLILGIICICNNKKEKKGKAVAGTIMSGIAIILTMLWIIISVITAPKNGQQTNSNYTNESIQNKQIEEEAKKAEKEEQQRKEQEEKEEQERKEQEEKEEQERKEQEEKEEQERKKQEEIQNFKDSCDSYTYEQLARNPDKVKGKNVKVTGEVIQVVNNNTSTELRVNITKNEAYSVTSYSDTIYVVYTPKAGEDKILEDDIITIYGISEGDTSYTSSLNIKITLPKINAKYIEIDE